MAPNLTDAECWKDIFNGVSTKKQKGGKKWIKNRIENKNKKMYDQILREISKERNK